VDAGFEVFQSQGEEGGVDPDANLKICSAALFEVFVGGGVEVVDGLVVVIKAKSDVVGAGERIGGVVAEHEVAVFNRAFCFVGFADEIHGFLVHRVNEAAGNIEFVAEGDAFFVGHDAAVGILGELPNG